MDNGSLHLALTSWGSAASDSGSILSRQGLNITQRGTPGGSGSITGLKARVAIVNARAQDCPSNLETSAPSRRDTQVIGAFFNDGTSTGPSDRTGDIIAVFVLEKAPGGVEPDRRLGQPVSERHLQPRLENCASGRKRAQMEARFGTVEVMRQP